LIAELLREREERLQSEQASMGPRSIDRGTSRYPNVF
jgi:hypothetical protein